MAGRKENFPGVDRQSRIQVPNVYHDDAIELLQAFWQKRDIKIKSFVPVAEFFVEKIPCGFWEPIVRLISELWKSKVITDKSKLEDVIGRLQGENIVLFTDTQVPASFGLEIPDNEKYEYLNLEAYFSSKKLNSRGQLVGLKVTGESMTGAGIFPRDLLVVENLSPLNEARKGDIVVARIGLEITVKRYSSSDSGFVLLVAESLTGAESQMYKAKEIEILGIVQYVIHDPANRR